MECIKLAVSECGYAERSEMVAQRIVYALREKYPGQRVYIPAPSRKEKYSAIQNEFNGKNKQDICRRWGISERWLYEIMHKKIDKR